MGISDKVALLRFKYHANAVEVVNVLNQLHIVSDLTAERENKKHVMTMVTDIAPRLKGNEEFTRYCAKVLKKSGR